MVSGSTPAGTGITARRAARTGTDEPGGGRPTAACSLTGLALDEPEAGARRLPRLGRRVGAEGDVECVSDERLVIGSATRPSR